MYLAYELNLKNGLSQESVDTKLFTGHIEYKYGLMFRSMPINSNTIKIQFFTILSDRFQFKVVEMPHELRKVFEKWFEVKQVNWYDYL